MVVRPSSPHGLALRSLILAGLVAFGLFVVAEQGLLETALDSDRSRLSWVILVVYLLASAHWMFLSVRLSSERNRLVRLEQSFEGEDPARLAITTDGVRIRGERDGEIGGERDGEEWTAGYLAPYLRSLLIKRAAEGRPPDPSVLATTLGDEIANRHAAGHFVSDTLLKLGLLGTMVGFIFMLIPVGEMTSFEPTLARQLLRDMSGGMAVALYTTLAGIITSTLLKLQYQMLDTSAQDFLNRLVVLTDVYLLHGPHDLHGPQDHRAAPAPATPPSVPQSEAADGA